MTSNAGTHWQDIQEKVFMRWCTDYLSERGMACNDLKTDFKDGLLLINLLEIISAKSLGRHNKHPRVINQKLENLNICIDFIKAEGLKLVNIGSEDINGGNLRIILGLIWTLILRYEIQCGGQADGSTGANALLEWVRSKIPEYDIKNFTKNWNDGRAICALTNAMKPGLIPDHRDKDPLNKFDNAKQGIDTASKALAVDPLIMPDEMNNPKVDKLSMMTYIAQFRNINLDDVNKPSDASRCQAYGPGLVEGIANDKAPFTVVVPTDAEGKLEIKVEGPNDAAAVTVVKKDNGYYEVEYLPTTPGTYKVHVTLGGEHIPGSIFTVEITEEESLGGEGKIRVFYSTTSSSEKGRRDRFSLEKLLQGKNVHLRDNFEPWYAVDVMDKSDRDRVFKKAGTRALPIIFVNDVYIGDYDKCMELEDKGALDGVLMVKGAALVTEEEHKARLNNMDPTAGQQEEEESTPAASVKPAAPKKAAPTVPKAAPVAAPAPAPTAAKFCTECGAKAGGKFCPACGNKL